jgi:hypothetical protein
MIMLSLLTLHKAFHDATALPSTPKRRLDYAAPVWYAVIPTSLLDVPPPPPSASVRQSRRRLAAIEAGLAAAATSSDLSGIFGVNRRVLVRRAASRLAAAALNPLALQAQWRKLQQESATTPSPPPPPPALPNTSLPLLLQWAQPTDVVAVAFGGSIGAALLPYTSACGVLPPAAPSLTGHGSGIYTITVASAANVSSSLECSSSFGGPGSQLASGSLGLGQGVQPGQCGRCGLLPAQDRSWTLLFVAGGGVGGGGGVGAQLSAVHALSMTLSPDDGTWMQKAWK